MGGWMGREWMSIGMLGMALFWIIVIAVAALLVRWLTKRKP